MVQSLESLLDSLTSVWGIMALCGAMGVLFLAWQALKEVARIVGGIAAIVIGVAFIASLVA